MPVDTSGALPFFCGKDSPRKKTVTEIGAVTIKYFKEDFNSTTWWCYPAAKLDQIPECRCFSYGFLPYQGSLSEHDWEDYSINNVISCTQTCISLYSKAMTFIKPFCI